MEVNEKLTIIANEIRTLADITGTLNLKAMADNINEINKEIADQGNLISNIISILENKAVKSNQSIVAMTVYNNTDFNMLIGGAEIPSKTSGIITSLEGFSAFLGITFVYADELDYYTYGIQYTADGITNSIIFTGYPCDTYYCNIAFTIRDIDCFEGIGELIINLVPLD